MKYRYKFLYDRDGKIKSQHGKEEWKIGEWQKVKEARLCNSGYHCSKGMYQAFSYIQGEILTKVEVRGDSDISNDKECYTEMRIVKAYKWQKKDSVALAIFAAELCLDNFEKLYPDDKRPRNAIEAAIKVLENDTPENRSAARSAAYSARSAYSAACSAYSAACSAAHSARSAAYSARSAYSAAHSAAYSAAYSARSAAYSARSAFLKNIEKWFKNHLKELEPYDN